MLPVHLDMDGAIMGKHRKSRDKKKVAVTILILVWIVGLSFYVVWRVM